MTRVLLFILTNLAVLLLAGVVLAVLESQGIMFPHMPLLVFAALFGMGGSFISLALSKWLAIRTTGAQVIEQPSNDHERWLVETVRQQAQAAGIGMPQVAIFPSDSPNAFATGARRDKSLVAVSTGLLHGMQREEVEAVLGHEVSHVANGDMITLTLIQGVLNTFVIFFSRIIGSLVDNFLSRGESRGPGIGYWVATIFAQVVLGALAGMVVCWFSRRREFRADAGGANLAGTNAMVGALRRLKSFQERGAEPLPDADGGVRHLRRRRADAPLHDAPAARGAHRRPRGASTRLRAVHRGRATARQLLDGRRKPGEHQAHKLALARRGGLAEDLLQLAARCVARDAAALGGLVEGESLAEQVDQLGLRLGEAVEGAQRVRSVRAAALQIGDVERRGGVLQGAVLLGLEQRGDQDGEGAPLRLAGDRHDAAPLTRALVGVDGLVEDALHQVLVPASAQLGVAAGDVEAVL